MSILNPYLWLAVLMMMAASYGTGRFQQYKSDKAEHTQALLKATNEARLKEQEWQERTLEIANEKEAELRSIAAERDRFASELRKRPNRLPEAARPACSGATGAELSSRDAEFLTGLAARADEFRAHLDACQKREAVVGVP